MAKRKPPVGPSLFDLTPVVKPLDGGPVVVGTVVETDDEPDSQPSPSKRHIPPINWVSDETIQ